LEAIENQAKSAENEAKAAKEETEKVKKELGDKITALEGRAPASIDATQYANIQAVVGLKLDGTANDAAGLAKDVKVLNEFITAIQASVGLDADGNLDPAVVGSLAEDVAGLKTFKIGTQANVGLGDDGYLTNEGLAQEVTLLKIDVAALPAKIVKGVNALGRTFTIGTPPKSPQIKPTDL